MWSGLFAAGAPADATASALHRRVVRYCQDCHGAEVQKGDLRLDDASVSDHALWARVYEQLASGQMPPAGEEQPSATERRDFAAAALAVAAAGPAPVAPVMLRRLNKREYANTVRDLLGLHRSSFDPGEFIYRDEVPDGFDTQARGLVLSAELLLEYMNAGETSLRHALFSPGPEKPPSVARDVPLGSSYAMPGGGQYFTAADDHAIIRSGGQMQFTEQVQSRPISAPGKYRITVVARGVGRHGYAFPLAPADAFRLGFGQRADRPTSVANPGEIHRVVTVSEEKDETFVCEMWLDRGSYPYLSFVNGHSKPVVQLRSAVRQGLATDADIAGRFRGPGIRISRFHIEGPLHDEWPTISHRTTLGGDGLPDLGDRTVRRAVVDRFVTRAFRRALAPGESEPFLAYAETQHAGGATWTDALMRTFTAVLASPGFLYFQEQPGALDAFALASRLSYFLWSTQPDDELSALARNGTLAQPAVWSAQVERLLADRRTARFSRSFVDQWLKLNALGTMRPDGRDPAFRIYYGENLESAMLEETRRYFDHVLTQNRPVRELVDSDYTFVNAGLARFYRLPPVAGEEFVRAPLPPDRRRGGILTHASVLTVTANGVETSPVHRGVWVLRNFLGRPPKPPPAEVPALVPDLNGVKTVRQLLEAHRRDAACRDCHNQIDPLGLALEGYDPIGSLRTRYPDGQTIDPTGTYGGKAFRDLSDLKGILLAEARPFARSLVIRLAEYAKGRRLLAADYVSVEAILDRCAPSEFRLRDLVVAVATSDLLLTR